MALVFPPLSSSHFKNPQVDDLRTAPFILYRRPVLIDDAYQQLCRDLGFEPNVVMENDEPESIKELVKLGLGVSFLPIWQVAEEAHKGKMRIVHLHKPHLYNYGLLYRKSGYKANMLLSLTTVAQQWKQWWPLAKYMGGTPA
jgi:DNA-binding transcriptional LysR family regulator